MSKDRFWSKVDMRGDEECWHWRGHSHARGYGIYWSEGRNVRANRHALFLAKGPPSDPSLMALHSCDNPPCCNPHHLRWGTAKDNADDRDLRMRGGRANAKTDEFTVTEIWRLRLRGFGCGEIAEMLHLSRSHVMNIYTGRSWAHLLGANGNPTLEELRASKPVKKRSAPNRKITDEMADDILRSRMNGESAREISTRLGLPLGTVSPVFCGIALTERLGVDGNPTFEELRSARAPHPGLKLTDDDADEIRALLARGYTGKSIAEKYGVSRARISNINQGKR